MSFILVSHCDVCKALYKGGCNLTVAFVGPVSAIISGSPRSLLASSVIQPVKLQTSELLLREVQKKACCMWAALTSTMRLTARTQIPRSAFPSSGTCFRKAGAPAPRDQAHFAALVQQSLIYYILIIYMLQKGFSPTFSPTSHAAFFFGKRLRICRETYRGT